MRNFLYLFLVCMLSSCGLETTEKAPDVSDIKADISIIRYDEAIRKATGENPSKDYMKLLSKHPKMTDLYFKSLIQIYDGDQSVFLQKIADFLSDERITKLLDTVSVIYPNLEDVEEDIEQSLKYYKHYFPARKLPNFYTVVTEFGYPSFIFEDQESDAVGIGLDMFLGEDFNYKLVNAQDPVFSDYMTRTYNKDHMAKKAIEMMVVDEIGDPPGKRFIDQMIHHGKRLYVLDKVLPFVSDTVIFEYTPAQLTWVENNERPMWNYFLENNLMYETNHLKVTKLLQPAPTSSGMPPESPGRTGAYMGYKIVEAFMKRNPDKTLRDLAGIMDSQLILESSKYKPKRN